MSRGLQLKDSFLDLPKKEIERLAIQNAQILIENGEADERLEYVKALKTKQFLDTFLKNLKERITDLQETTFANEKELFGVEFQVRNPSETLNYNEDHEIQFLQEEIKERKKLLEAAAISEKPIYDETGTEVPKVSKKIYGGGLISKIK